MERMGYNLGGGQNLPPSMIGLEKDNQTKLEFFGDDKKAQKEIDNYQEQLKKEAAELKEVAEREGINVKLLKKAGDTILASGFTLEEYKNEKSLLMN